MNAPGGYSLEKTVERLEAAAKAAGVVVKAAALGQRTDDRDTLELVKNIVTGTELHPSLTPLAMRLAVGGVAKDTATALLQGMMHGAGSPADVRWGARYGEIPGIVGSAYAKLDFANAPAWTLGLERNAAGTIVTDWVNIHRAFRKAPPFAGAPLRLNMRARQLEVHDELPWSRGLATPRQWTDNDVTGACIWLNSQGFAKVKVNDVNRAALFTGQDNAFDPLADYLNGLQWDGVPRIDSWLIDYCGAATRSDGQLAYVREVSARWLLQAVARALRPGCKADCVLIFEGVQGIRKSTALARLGGPWFTELTADISHGGRDTLMNLANAWIVEISELDALRRADVARIKAFFSQTVDRYRAPYERTTEDHPRTVVFAGTMNPDGNDYLQDTTGNRRFWPVEVLGVGPARLIDTEALESDRDQLWAEAVVRYKRGERTWIEGVDLELAAKAEQSARSSEDPWFEVVQQWVVTQQIDVTTSTETLAAALNIPPKDQDRGKEIRVARILKQVGMRRAHTRTGKKWVSVFE